MTDGVHHSAVVGGSNAGRVLACPPSRLSGVPVPDTGTQYTERGTVLHKAMEDYLATGALPDVVQTTPIVGEMREAADEAIRLWSLIASDVTVKQVHVELKLHMQPIPGAFGTTDVLIEHHTNTVTLLDWKFGVTPVTWDQLLFYAGCAMTDKQTRHLFNGKTEIRMVVIQPNERDGKTFRTKTVDVLTVFDFMRRLTWAVDNGHRDELLRSGDHCKFCPVRIVCPLLQKQATQALTYEDPHKLSPEQAADALTLADNLEHWIASVRQYAHERLNGGGVIPGFKLVAKRAQRKWKDEDAVKSWGNRVGVPVTDEKMKTPAAVERLVKKREVELPADLYTKTSSGTVVAPDSDPREQVAGAAQFKQAAEKLRALSLLQN